MDFKPSVVVAIAEALDVEEVAIVEAVATKVQEIVITMEVKTEDVVEEAVAITAEELVVEYVDHQ